MAEFFNKDVLLDGVASKAIYKEIKALPIIDYHCHLNQKMIHDDAKFADIGELWLSGDHYKWRAMRMNGIDEKYITGDASYEEKFYKYASIVPNLVGGPLYYWTHLELQQVFGIFDPLNEKTAKDIYKRANEKLKNLSVRKLLELFNVEFVATTDDPIDDLEFNQKYGNTTVSPTFRCDKVFTYDPEYFNKLSKVSGIEINSIASLKEALVKRLDYFVSKGCKIVDTGFKSFPHEYALDEEAEEIFKHYKLGLSEVEKEKLFGNILLFLLKEYKKRNMLVQLHFAVIRNINTPMFKKLGVDQGFDVIAKENDIEDVMVFLDKLTDEERPTCVLYTLNPNTIAPLACVSGAFRNVLIGAAWWFNDTLNGIKRNLDLVSEYACLGTNLGMLTDSRSFSSYSRFDFFRRILASFLGEKVDKGEYPLEDAIRLAKNISYYNVKNILGE